MSGYSRVDLSDAGGDTRRTGMARVHLKLAAMAYVGATHGADGNAEIARAGLVVLCENSLRYYEALKELPVGHIFDRWIEHDGCCTDGTPIGIARGRIKLAALAYVTARNGSDSNVEIARAGTAIMCDAAIRYCELILSQQFGARSAQQLTRG